jgi:hypothetical protein
MEKINNQEYLTIIIWKPITQIDIADVKNLIKTTGPKILLNS